MSVILLIVALVFFALASLGIPSPRRIEWVAAGLFFGFLWLGVSGEGLSKLFN